MLYACDVRLFYWSMELLAFASRQFAPDSYVCFIHIAYYFLVSERIIAGGSRTLRSLTRKNSYYRTKCEWMKQTERSMIFGANWRLANAKSSMAYENKLDAACMDEIKRMEKKSSVQANPSRITLAKVLCEWMYVFCKRSRF